MGKFFISKKTIVGFVILLLIILAFGAVSYVFFSQSAAVDIEKSKLSQLRMACQRVRIMVSEIEKSHLIFLSSGNEQLNDQVKEKSGSLSKELEVIELQAKRYAELRLTTEELVKALDWIQTLPETSSPETTAEMSGAHSKKLDTTFESTFILLNSLENLSFSLEDKIQRSSTQRRRMFMMVVAGLLLLGLSVTAAIMYEFNRLLRHKAIAESRLVHDRDTIRYLYEKAPCGYLTVNRDGMVINANETMLLWAGYSRAEMLDRLHVSILIPSWEDLISSPTNRHQERTDSIEGESEIMTKSGEVILGLISLAKSSFPPGSYNISLVDYTQRKKMEQHLIQNNNDLEAFSYSISHDLRAPLRAINSYSTLLKEGYANKIDSEGIRMIDTIVRNAVNMGVLIEDLLRLSKTSRQEVVKSEVNMTQMVNHVINNLMSDERAENTKLIIHDLGLAMADIGLIRQVWVNLISNAFKYSRVVAQPIIEIGSSKDEMNLTFYIKDNGVGFDMQYYDKLFAVFKRLHHKRDFEGTGVGLSLVKRIVENHKGCIWAEGEPDKGAVFYFTLPRF